jgi:hypothetical protein
MERRIDIAKRLSPAQAAFVPVGLAAAIAGLTRVVPQIALQPVVARSFLGAALALVLGSVVLVVIASRNGGELSIEAALKKPHYVQSSAQLALMAYWGWHVRAVYGNLPLVAGQLMFAYGLDALIQLIRRGRYQIGFGPVPIVVSINFFLWFKPEYYYWQFVIIALGYAAKEFVHWQRDGRTRHIFNPSSFPLSVFSLVLILTGMTGATYGLEIAQSLFNPPYMYLAIFLVALPAQVLFGVATMTIASVATAYLWSLGYFAVTGTFFFRDAYIPIAVFLGMHLLFTDPATSPRTEQGRVIFGVLYAVFTIALAGLLEAVGAPTFYDKLLPIPILNTMVRAIDRVAVTGFFRHLVPARVFAFAGLQARHATAALWTLGFATLFLVGGVGDDHPGQYLPFWDQACDDGSRRACEYVVFIEQVYCARGSGWACNAQGIVLVTKFGDVSAARRDFERACALGSRSGCANVLNLTSMSARVPGDASFAQAPPPLEELPIIIRGSKGPVLERDPTALYSLACERGWPETCSGP